jgi:hypothetical protein
MLTTTTIGEIVRGDREIFPPYLYEAYQSTRRRAARIPVLDLPVSNAEIRNTGQASSSVTR